MAAGQGIDPVIREILSTDLRLLAALQDRELDADRAVGLASVPAAEWLGLELASEAAANGFQMLDAGIADLGDPVDPAALDRLAADYADIYLNYTFQASPNESVWLDKDHLERQEPMFDIRKWYAHYGLAVENWSCRTEDNLVLQLAFLAHLFEHEAPHAVADAAHFLDRHPLCWVPAFAMRVSRRCGTPFYGGLVLVTAAYLDELRDYLAEVLDLPRPEIVEADTGVAEAGSADENAATYFPGAGPGW